MTTPPRIAPRAKPHPPDVAGLLTSLMPPGMEPLKLFTTVAHHPEILKVMRGTGNLIYKSGLLDATLRELIIQRVCARKGAEYEWGVTPRCSASATTSRARG